MKPPIVAVSQRIDCWPERQESRDALDQRLAAWLMRAGCLPFPVPNIFSTSDLVKWLETLQPTAIVLSGGNDIGQMPARDQTESTLLNWAEAQHLPVLGICRGMQMMGVWAGVTLTEVKGHVGTSHMLQGAITGRANSFHHLALAACPAQFQILAKAEDEAIEAIAHTRLPWEGWMWHPEREAIYDTRDIRRVRRLFGL